ncbi:hypothetical protein E1091_14205 [Micromonospora fluostatini]|uniref:Helix-turn-helix domain-containing protein n=1 Tax=Micromonospora fluostatini TaxID=1629071 RepID=A0ABY2DEN5_9ACTN|nr:hypothetical protein E1091_14205 [Micromonospora fluostatini]
MDELETAGREHAAAKAAYEATRARLAELVVAAARAGRKQGDIVKASGYTRERVRQICRAAGIDPA